MAEKNSEKKVEQLAIPAPNIKMARIPIVGTSPLVMSSMSHKLKEMMKNQAAGSTARSKRTRTRKDFEKLFRDAAHVSEDGWYGIPATAFRQAMIDACRLVGFKMTHAKMSVFCEPDGFGAVDGKPLVRLIAGEPERHLDHGRNADGSVDVRMRPMWRKWEAAPLLRWDGDQFTEKDVANLLRRVGLQVGLLEGRHYSKKSAGQGWGCFDLKDVVESNEEVA